jgi:hypothetical protein
MAPRGHFSDAGAAPGRFQLNLALLAQGSSDNRLKRRRDATKDKVLRRLGNVVKRRF